MGKLFSSTKRRECAPGSDINNVCLHTTPLLLIQGSLPCSQAIHTNGKIDCRVQLYEHHMYLLLHLRGLKHPSKMWDPIFRCFLFCILFWIWYCLHQCLTLWPWLAWNLLFRAAWTHRDPLAFVSLEYWDWKYCITPGLEFIHFK